MTNKPPGPYSIGSSHWPGLSKLIEEAAEVLQVCGKIQGCNGEKIHWDGSDLPDRLADELGQLKASIEFVVEKCNLDRVRVEESRDTKMRLYEEWHSTEVVVYGPGGFSTPKTRAGVETARLASEVRPAQPNLDWMIELEKTATVGAGCGNPSQTAGQKAILFGERYRTGSIADLIHDCVVVETHEAAERVGLAYLTQSMTPDERAVQRIHELEDAIKKFASQALDHLCWQDLRDLAKLVGVEYTPAILSRELFEANCKRYQDCLYAVREYSPDNVTKLVDDLHAQVASRDTVIEDLRAQVAALSNKLADANWDLTT
jgi:hypothetical protein